VQDSLIIGLELPGGKYYLPLFLVLHPDATLTSELQNQIKQALRKRISPHYVPDEILLIAEVPRTLSGKKVEVPVKKILQGIAWEKAISKDAMANPDSLQPFMKLRQKIEAEEQV
jgi:acetoacetyl-CoA synthetase